MHVHSTPMSPAPGPSFEHVETMRVIAKQPFTYIDADGLLDIPGLQRLDRARLQRQTRRLVMLGGRHMNVLSDVAALTCFMHSKDGRSWSMNMRIVNEHTAPSLVYMRGGQEVGSRALLLRRAAAARVQRLRVCCCALSAAAPSLLLRPLCCGMRC